MPIWRNRPSMPKVRASSGTMGTMLRPTFLTRRAPSELSEHLAYNPGGREEPNDLRPDNVTSHNATLGNRRFQGFTGIPAKSGVADDKIEDDAAIDGGDHVEMLLRAVRL